MTYYKFWGELQYLFVTNSTCFSFSGILNLLYQPPEELRYPGYKGCIEFSTLNDRILGLYNFHHAVNITNNDKCLRY